MPRHVYLVIGTSILGTDNILSIFKIEKQPHKLTFNTIEGINNFANKCRETFLINKHLTALLKRVIILFINTENNLKYPILYLLKHQVLFLP